MKVNFYRLFPMASNRVRDSAEILFYFSVGASTVVKRAK